MNIWDEEDFMIGEASPYRSPGKADDNEVPVTHHYHSCPECYEHHQCTMNCTIEPDLSRDGRQFGSHCLCDACEKKSKQLQDNKYIKIYSKEWWDIYNGFAQLKPYIDEQGNVKYWYSMG